MLIARAAYSSLMFGPGLGVRLRRFLTLQSRVRSSTVLIQISNLNSILLAGITPSNEVRDAPNYLRPVSSEPTDHDSTVRHLVLQAKEEEGEKCKASTLQPSLLISYEKT